MWGSEDAESGDWRQAAAAGNWRKHFINGELVEVKAIASGEIHLTDGRAIPPGYNTFTHVMR